jgi:hypothetical protein
MRDPGLKTSAWRIHFPESKQTEHKISCAFAESILVSLIFCPTGGAFCGGTAMIVVAFYPEEVIVFRHNECQPLRKMCAFLRWKIIADSAGWDDTPSTPPKG